MGEKYGKVAWKDLCLPKEEGGLGHRDLKSWNSALHTKILWNIHSKKDLLWIRWIHSEYIKNGTIWGWTTRKKKDSSLIKRIQTVRDEMLGKCSREEVIMLWTSWYATNRTQEAYEWFRPKGERGFWAKYVWKDFVPPKYSFITWLTVRERLQTRDIMHYLDIDRTCQLCGDFEESAEHLFFKCTKTKVVWNGNMDWLDVWRRITTIKSAIKWAARQNRGSAILQEAKRIALMATVTHIWKTRNAVIFDAKLTILESERRVPASLP